MRSHCSAMPPRSTAWDVFAVTEDLATMTNTHEWCVPGIEPQIDSLQSVVLSDMPRLRDTLARGHSIHIRRVAELTEDWHLEQAEFERQGIRSVVAVPLMNGGKLRGLVGLDSVVRDRTWDDDTIRMLRTVVGILASLLARCEAQRDAHVHEARFRAVGPTFLGHDRPARPRRPVDVHRGPSVPSRWGSYPAPSPG